MNLKLEELPYFDGLGVLMEIFSLGGEYDVQYNLQLDTASLFFIGIAIYIDRKEKEKIDV